jgi:HD-GYP domain-containing protein (c-di-GMP phosphodiesterase class II)
LDMENQHDIGKLGIPKSVLDKPGPLTTQEWALIKQHPVIGARIISSALMWSQYSPDS